MRVCLVSGDSAAALAGLLATRHEVTVIDPAVEPGEELETMVLANEHHLRSAAILAEIEAAYEDDGPDYLEAPDRFAPALMPLMARRGGHRSLRETAIGLRLIGSAELIALHDAELAVDGMAALCDLEREQFRLADRVLWPGGNGADLYRRYYEGALPPAARIGIPLELAGDRAAGPADRDQRGPLRILYYGRLSRGKGAGDLAEACLRLPNDDWELTMIGPDSETTTFKQSMRHSIEEMFGGDPRIRLGEVPSGEARARLISEHDLIVVPSRFDVWPTEALEAMSAGLPVLATPVGGLLEIVADGVTGWFTGGVGRAAIAAGLGPLVDHPEEVRELRESGEAQARAKRLADPEEILAGYQRLFDEIAPAPAANGARPGRAPEPLVSAVMPYYRCADHVEEAIDSFFAQTHGTLEAVIVNDGSFEEADEVLGRLAERPGVTVVTQLNCGEAAARNLAIQLAEGDYLVMLDADNVLEPEFVARALDVLRHEPSVAYVSSWLRFIAEDGSPYPDCAGCAHLGNRVMRDDAVNWDGDTLAMVPRALLVDLGFFHETEATTHTDWEFYRRLREENRFGMVIPEPLARYRVRPGSLMRSWSAETLGRGWLETTDRRIRRRTDWEGVPESGG